MNWIKTAERIPEPEDFCHLENPILFFVGGEIYYGYFISGDYTVSEEPQFWECSDQGYWFNVSEVSHWLKVEPPK